LNDDGVDISTSVELKYANGGVARFKTSGVAELANKANIRGSKAFMTVRFRYQSTQLAASSTTDKI